MYHGRNLDYPHPVLKNLTFNAVFLKNGKVHHALAQLKLLRDNLNFLDVKSGLCFIDTPFQEVYRGTSFAGYVGLWTGQSPNKFTVSGDQRGKTTHGCGKGNIFIFLLVAKLVFFP